MHYDSKDAGKSLYEESCSWSRKGEGSRKMRSWERSGEPPSSIVFLYSFSFFIYSSLLYFSKIERYEYHQVLDSHLKLFDLCVRFQLMVKAGKKIRNSYELFVLKLTIQNSWVSKFGCIYRFE